MSAKCFVKILLIEVLVILGWGKVFADTPDSALLAVENRNGLYFKWSVDGEQWHTINHCFLTSDYGPWGSHKKMHDPVLTREDGRWKCVFRADENVYGRTVSPDLIHWKPQDYYIDRDAKKDLSSYTDTFEVDWQTIDNLMKTAQLSAYKRLLYDEQAKDDAVRFAGLQPVKATMTVDTGKPKKISDKLIGVFFEDINYAADGGLYAELLQNRDFEYSPKDRREWNSTTAWTIDTRHSRHEIKIDTLNPLHPNNPHHVVLESGQTLVNEGFDGIAIKQGDKYDFSMFAKAEKPGRIAVKLIDNKGNAASNEVSIKIGAENWKKYEAVLTARQTATNAKLQVAVSPLPDNVIGGAGWEVRCDLFSLFPQKTFKDRKNGLRADLAQAIADLKPRFVRFPGGCLAHGNGIENIYRWKESIGKLEERKPDFNIWGYHQTKGLGYFEYFQFCEDIGAEPLPILAAGVPCQNSRKGKNGLAGQQGGIPLEEMEAYIQDILDLIEWANGDKSTTWGKLRAQAGHPEPFNLKYIGIGNEDLISEVFKERFEMIFKAIEEKAEELNQTKLQFFTNITHEFLTPLTIISASVDELKMTTPRTDDIFTVITQNITRLMRLFQQILEFRKAESGNLKLRVLYGNLSDFVRTKTESFRPLIKKKKLHLSVVSDPDNISGYFDPDKIDKILYNLLSNAAKYTPEDGFIQVNLSHKSNNRDYVLLSVKDNGCGISAEDQKNLFTRFYEGDYRRFNTTGTGIGLSLTKDLANLHYGDIHVESEPGKGCTFHVSFPIEKSYFNSYEIEKEAAVVDENIAKNPSNTINVDKNAQSKNKLQAPTLLVVEDNEELLQLMVRLLSKEYNILTAENGKEAIVIIENEPVELIISDIIMPEMDGIELCRFVKNTIEYSHIPIILLTAKNKEEDKAEAYESGADDFISKPFNLSVLYARIKNLLKNRERMAGDFKNQVFFELKDLNYTSIDQQFIQKAIECVYRHLDDVEFDQAQFVEEMGTSKSTLYNKLKSLTGLNTSAFIRNIRLKAACKIMEETQNIRISELAYRVGFNDPKYFSSCFKKEFNMPPSEYMERFVLKNESQEES
jgi:signal transduction histidine kinase/DNA-binding response OmpR family regulator